MAVSFLFLFYYIILFLTQAANLSLVNEEFCNVPRRADYVAVPEVLARDELDGCLGLNVTAQDTSNQLRGFVVNLVEYRHLIIVIIIIILWRARMRIKRDQAIIPDPQPKFSTRYRSTNSSSINNEQLYWWK